MVPEPYLQCRSHAAISFQPIWHKFPDLINREAVYCFGITLVNLGVDEAQHLLHGCFAQDLGIEHLVARVVAPVLIHEPPRVGGQLLGRLQPGEYRGNDDDGLAAARMREGAAKRHPAPRAGRGARPDPTLDLL